MHQRDTLYINGNWVAPSGQGKIEVIEASTEQVIGSVPEGDARDGLDEFHENKSLQCRPVRFAYPASSCST